MKLSRKAQLLKPSPTLAMAAKARELAAQGHDVISLTVGEPDWNTFESANLAAIQAIKEGFTKYTASAGIIELRQALCRQIQQELKLDYKTDQVIVGSGAKFVIYALFQMLLDADDEVIIPSPYWVSYPTIAELAGARPVIFSCGEKQNFKMTAEQLEKAITKKTKILILSSPSNPTGISYSRNDWMQIAEVLRKHPEVTLVSDDIYDKLVFDDSNNNQIMENNVKRAIHILDVAPDLKDRVIIVNGASKTYAMTGWRIGWAFGPAEIMKVTADFLSQSTSNVTSISQKAALAAIQADSLELKKAVAVLQAKRNRMLQQSKDFKFFEVIRPDGAFYFWMKVEKFFGKSVKAFVIKNSADLAKVLLENYFVASVPGIDFGLEGYLRFSIAASDIQLDKAWKRLYQLEADCR